MRRAGAALAGLAAVLAAGAVLAQPSQPPLITLPPAAPAAPPVAEEAPPPATTPAPAPVVTPPIAAEDVKPAAPPPSAAKPAGPPRRVRYDVAVVQALDKITAESLKFEAQVGKPVRFKNLIVTVRACERSMPDEAVPDSIAYLTVDSQPRPGAGKASPPARQVFKGWMYASSPGLHPLEHAVYDAWLIECRAKAPVSPVAIR